MGINLKKVMLLAQDEACKFIKENAKDGMYGSGDPLAKDKITRNYIEALVANAVIAYHNELSDILGKHGIDI